jgi:hypothetical protein
LPGLALIGSYRHDNSPSAAFPGGLLLVRYLDLVLIALGAPIFLLMGVSVTGYLAGAGVWLALRLVGVALERYLRASPDARREISLRLAYLLARVFLLALTVVLVRRDAGKDAALAALGVIVFAFTVQLVISFADRPRSS